MSKFKFNEEVVANIPSIVSPPFSAGHTVWLSAVTKLRGKTVRLHMPSSTNFSGHLGLVHGWQVTHNEPTLLAHSSWLPEEWLQAIPVQPSSSTPIVTQPLAAPAGIGYCSACGGAGRHKLMCPKARTS